MLCIAASQKTHRRRVPPHSVQDKTEELFRTGKARFHVTSADKMHTGPRAVPYALQGMDAPLQRALDRRIPVRGSFPRGRSYLWHCDRGDICRTVPWEVARTLRRGADTFHIRLNHQPVDMRAPVPVPEQGSVNITLHRGRHPRQPDEPPARQAPPPPSPSRSRSRSGQLEMLLALQDFGADAWAEVTIQQAAQKLMEIYQPLLGGITRLALTTRAGRVYREGDNLEEAANDDIGMMWAVPQLQGGLGAKQTTPKQWLRRWTSHERRQQARRNERTISVYKWCAGRWGHHRLIESMCPALS